MKIDEYKNKIRAVDAETRRQIGSGVYIDREIAKMLKNTDEIPDKSLYRHRGGDNDDHYKDDEPKENPNAYDEDGDR